MDDHSAIEQLVHSRQQELFAFLLARCANREEARDLLQDIFLQLWRHRATVLALTEVEQGRYLWAAARNRATDAARNKDRHLARSTRALTDADEPGMPEAQGDDRMVMLQHCIDDLPAGDRELFLMATIGELDSAAIAERLGSKPKTIRSRLSRIRAALRERLTALISGNHA